VPFRRIEATRGRGERATNLGVHTFGEFETGGGHEHVDGTAVLIDPVQVAAAMNPAMSSWVALRRRIDFRRRQRVLILGATGYAILRQSALGDPARGGRRRRRVRCQPARAGR
jgi:hypothetical protein